MSYIACKTGFIFKCLVQNCKFQTMDNPAFVDHIENEHLAVKWLGHCVICNSNVDSTRSIIFELMHMRENHVLKEDSNADDLPDITEYSEPEVIKKMEVENENSKLAKSENVTKKNANKEANSSIEKLALVGKKIDIGKIKLIPYKGTPLSPKSPEIEIKKPSSLADSNKPAVSQQDTSTDKKDVQSDTNKSINTVSKKPGIKQQEISVNTPDGKQKIIKHIIVKPPQDKESSPLVVKLKQPNGSAQKLQPASAKPQTPNAEQKLIIQRQKSTDSQKDMSSADLLRPWLKRKVKKYLMPTTRFLNNVGAIISTYKCMSSKCSFYTSDRDIFNAHLRFHETHQTGDRDYLNCSYCDFLIFNEKDQVTALVDHIDSEHCFDKYQCKYCFYRSCVSLNVINHQRIYHAMKPKSVYELSCDKNRDYEQELATVKKSRLKCVPPLSCVKCNAKFYLFPKLSAHMQTHGPNIKTKCTKCSKVSDLSNIHTHFINCHNLGLYQCVFCVFGSNNFDNIINHIGNCHPSKPPIYCERSNDKADEVNPASIESTCLKFLTQQVDHRIIETPKINPDILKNEKNVGDLGGNFKVYPSTKTKTPSPNKDPQPVKKASEAKLGSALKKVESKMASATELVKEIETIKKKSQKAEGISNEKTTGLQIKSVFSLNKF
ncbi:zinc finger protein ZFAT-like [Chironomus tepperi]|uniref:zinc finger protein ZFAT-like n=1 Tax=Chironomus tepperi TaxID=113505 RepID=UPI00391EF79F